MVSGELYYGKTDGTFNERTFDGTTLRRRGQDRPVQRPVLEHDQQRVGRHLPRASCRTSTASCPNVSSMFFSNGRIYYTLVGQSRMFYRYFTPDSGVIGADQFTVNDGGMNWSDIAGAFVTGNTLYYATKSDGVAALDRLVDRPCHRQLDRRRQHAELGQPRAVPALRRLRATSHRWRRSRATCGSGTLSCSFDASARSTRTARSPATTGTSVTARPSTTPTRRASHTYGSAGDKTVTLTVTDNDGATNVTTRMVVHPTTAHSADLVRRGDRPGDVRQDRPAGRPEPAPARVTRCCCSRPGTAQASRPPRRPAGPLQQSYVNASGDEDERLLQGGHRRRDIGGTAIATFGSR